MTGLNNPADFESGFSNRQGSRQMMLGPKDRIPLILLFGHQRHGSDQIILYSQSTRILIILVYRTRLALCLSLSRTNNTPTNYHGCYSQTRAGLWHVQRTRNDGDRRLDEHGQTILAGGSVREA